MKSVRLFEAAPLSLQITVGATLVFVLATAAVQFPTLADDHWWRWLSALKPGFPITEPYMFSRMPVLTALSTWATRYELWLRWPQLFLGFFFALHALAFGLLFERLLGKKVWPYAALVGVVFALQPNNYEIHFWHLLSLHAVGALSIALAFRMRSPWAALVFGTLGLLTYDSFFFLLPGFAVLLGLRERANFQLRRYWWIGAALLLGAATKFILGRWLGYLQVVPFDLDLWKVLDHTKVVFRTLWLMHFYKPSWPLTLVAWSGVAWAVFLAKDRFGLKRLLLWLVAPTIIALPLALNAYEAPRAYYGPQILQALMLAVLFLSAFQEKACSATAALALVALAFVLQGVLILSLKQSNYNALEAIEAKAVESMQACVEPCALVLPPPTEGLQRDWILPEMFWDEFYERIRLERFPNKKIEITIKS